MTTRNNNLTKICLFVVVFMAIPLCAYSAMTFFLKDGRKLNVPVTPDEILSISFDTPTAQPTTYITPATLPISDGLAVWLDASDLSSLFQSSEGFEKVSSGNQLVGLWRDKSGNDNHMVQARAENRPRLIKSGIANKSTISFETSQSVSLATNFPSPVSVFYVARMTGGTNARVLKSLNNNWLLGYWMGAMNQAYYEGWVSPSGNPAADNLPHVFTAIVTGPGHNSEAWADGRQIATNQAGVTGPNGLAINTGVFGGETSNCQVAEILLYNRALSGDERRNVETYLKEKWHIAR